MNTLPFAPAVRPVLRRADLPLPAATAHGRRAGRHRAPFVTGRRRVRHRLRLLRLRRATPDDASAQEGTCTTPTRANRSPSGSNDPDGGAGPAIRVFAGVRWDPFIMDAPAALKTIATRKLAFTDPGSIYLDGKNVLSLVVEIDTGSPGRARRWSVSSPRR